MLTLAIDTSGQAGSVAVARPGELLAERSLDLRVHHGQSLVPEVDRVLQDLSLTPQSVELVSVVVGPGSFTGLRVGVVFAKTFAWAVGCRVVAVETFESIAAGIDPADGQELHLFADAQRGEVFSQIFVRHAERELAWIARGPIEILTTAAWAAALQAGSLVGGPGLVKHTALIPETARQVEAVAPQASVVAQIGLHKAAAGQSSDLWKLEPLYLRRTSAEVQWEALGRK